MKENVLRLVLGSLCLAGIAGCTNKPARIAAPEWNPSGMSAQAMELYDTNKDGKIAGDELNGVPSFRDSLASMDKDGDKALSQEEIQGRFESFVKNRLGLTSQSCVVIMRGNPIGGALVTFEPEPFVADMIKPATGTTQPDGSAILISEGETLGMKPGFYKVRISLKDPSGKERIKPDYNEKTTLGKEISLENPELAMGPLVFNLK